MKYYVIEIQRNAEGVESKGIYSYDTRDQAAAVFHTKMASGITAGIEGTLKYVLNAVMNEYGNIEMIERWIAPEEQEVQVNE